MRADFINRTGRTRPSVFIGFILLCLLLCASLSRGQSVSLTWNPGPSGQTAGYYLYFGTSSASYSTRLDVGTNTVATLSGLAVGQTYYFAVTAYDSSRIESLPSNQASFVVPSNPSALAPQVAAVTPSSGSPGAQVFIYGTNFTTTASVQFDGVNAPFNVSSDGSLVATVPAGAASGPLAITTANGVVSFNFVVVPAPPPANDNFNNAQLLTGVSALVSTNTTGATKQPGEPNHAGNAGGSSVWYRWTAPAAGIWTLNTTGSSFTTLLTVYTGNTLTGLSTVASNLVAPGVFASSLSFTAVAGVTYQIAIDGFSGAAGNLALSLAPASVPATIYATSFESTQGFSSIGTLAGLDGWLTSGTATTGIKFESFPDFGQQAFIGFASTVPDTTSLAYVPLNYTVNTNLAPLIQFSVMMQISASASSPYNGVFAWIVRNASGQELFRISFDDITKALSFTLNSGAGQTYTGISFNNSTIYTLAISLDFSHNLWSAYLNGTLIIPGQPISVSGAALTLGDIDASETFRAPTVPGTDGMLFDNYSITASAGPSPVILQGPSNQTVAAGANAFLGANASGAPPLYYQWYLNNNPISSATNSSLFLAGLTAGQAGTYSLEVTNVYGGAAADATLAVTTPPPKSFFAKPVSLGGSGALLSLNVAAGNSYTFQASTNLRDWINLGTFMATGTNTLCFDPAAATAPRRFYRLVSP